MNTMYYDDVTISACIICMPINSITRIELFQFVRQIKVALTFIYHKVTIFCQHSDLTNATIHVNVGDLRCQHLTFKTNRDLHFSHP